MDYDFRLWEALERQRQLITEVKYDRILRAIRENRPRKPSFARRLLGLLGRGLISLGTRLQQVERQQDFSQQEPQTI